MVKLTEQEKKAAEELKKDDRGRPVRLKKLNVMPGTRIVPSSIKGLRSFTAPETKNIALRNIDYIELVKEYDTYLLVKVCTKVPLKKIKNTGGEKYYSYIESVLKCENLDIKFE